MMPTPLSTPVSMQIPISPTTMTTTTTAIPPEVIQGDHSLTQPQSLELKTYMPLPLPQPELPQQDLDSTITQRLDQLDLQRFNFFQIHPAALLKSQHGSNCEQYILYDPRYKESFGALMEIEDDEWLNVMNHILCEFLTNGRCTPPFRRFSKQDALFLRDMSRPSMLP